MADPAGGKSGILGARTHLLALLAKEAADLVERLQPSVVWVQSGHGHGSGLIWDRAGLIVTNHHVVSGDRARIELGDGRHLAARVVGRDPHNDLAALEISADHLSGQLFSPGCAHPAAPGTRPPAPIGDSSALRVGELIIAVGHPFGVRGTATLGIVSRALTSPSRGAGMRHTGRELLQADVDLAPGNSGGPLVNTAGEVVGIASMVAGPGIALAVPSHVVCRFVAALRAAPGALRACEAARAARRRQAA